METEAKSNTIATGLAMFSMFFGAGNVVFPLAIGQYAQDQNFYAILGLSITAILVPFLGLIAMTLFDGNYKHFFERIGKTPGFLVALLIMALIGPFGALPRCIALSYSSINLFFPGITLPVFSFISCVIIYLLAYKKSSILDILGYVLTPFLLGSLLLIIVKGLIVSPSAPIADHSAIQTFYQGLKQGYQTMDLLGAFFFSSIVISCLKKDQPETVHQNHKKLIFMTLKASCIGAFLIGVVYIGFSYVAAFNSASLEGVKSDQLIGTLAIQTLGSWGGLVASMAVALACLTTAIALAAVSAEFIHKDITQGKVNYIPALLLTLIVSFFVSTLDFTGIVKFLAPILEVLYPALIVLSICNIAHKLWHAQSVKIPVFITLALSLLSAAYAIW